MLKKKNLETERNYSQRVRNTGVVEPNDRDGKEQRNHQNTRGPALEVQYLSPRSSKENRGNRVEEILQEHIRELERTLVTIARPTKFPEK